MCESMDKNRVQGASVGRAGHLPRSLRLSAEYRIGWLQQAYAHWRPFALLTVN
jgi:hypothetical protein